MKKMILILMLFSLSAIADGTVTISNDTPTITMADLKAGDELLVTNDNEIFTSVTFKEMCFVPTPDGFESKALLAGMAEAGAVIDFSGTFLPDKTPVESVKMVPQTFCSMDGDFTFLVPKSQLFGLLTRLENIMTAVRERKIFVARDAVTALQKDHANVSKEAAELRRLLNSL